MKFIDEFRDKALVDRLAGRIRSAADSRGAFNIMEVCGTHTMAIFRFGLRRLLPRNVRLTSGPGCPVCVTPNGYLDRAIALARLPDVIIATFGDMLRVPGSYSSLEKERAAGALVKTVYSTDDALDIAAKNPGRQVVFLGVGFETTAPTVGSSIIAAGKRRVKNYSVLCAHKTMPEALEALVKAGDMNVDGFLLPGHVSAIIGVKPYGFIAKRYGKSAVAAGFEPVDILQTILMILEQKRPKIEIQYDRIIDPDGNARAREVMGRVFEKCPSEWRGIGVIKDSGLKIRKEFSGFDASLRFSVRSIRPREDKACICGPVLRGVKSPPDCRLFGKRCTPDDPVGACMVSAEGTCAAYYRYGQR